MLRRWSVRLVLLAVVTTAVVGLIVRTTAPSPSVVKRPVDPRSAAAPFNAAASAAQGGQLVMEPVTPLVVDFSRVVDALPEMRLPTGETENDTPLTAEEIAALKEAALALPADSAVQRAPAEGLAPSPGPVNFASIYYQQGGGSVPPDPEMAAGPDHLIAVVNVAIAIYDKAGTALLGPTAAGNVFTGTNCRSGLYDPNVAYDEEAQRYLIIFDKGAQTSTGGLCVLASQTSNAMGSWYEYFFRTNSTSGWLDYPHTGVGDEYIVTGGNIFSLSNSFVESRLYGFEKSRLYSGLSVTPVVKALPGDFFTPQPLKVHGASGGTWPAFGNTHYILGDYYDGRRYALLRWNIAANTLTTVNTVDLGLAGFPLDVPQLGGQPVRANDWRALDFEYRNGYGWFTATVSCNPGAGSVNCVRWAQLNLSTGTVGPAGSGLYGSDGVYRFFPDLAVDHCGNMVVGYSHSSSSTYPSVYVTGRLKADPAGQLQSEALLKAGEIVYTAFDSAPRRWGDYTGFTVDPDGVRLWYLGQYSRDTGSTSGRWGTYVGSFTYNCQVTPDFDLLVGPPTQDVCIGNPAAYSLDVFSLAFFNGSVALSTANLPAGATATFTPNPVTAPGSSALTVGTAGAAAGTYTFDVVGNAPGLTRSTPLGLRLFAAAPSAPTPLGPANGAAFQSVRPFLSWSADANATGYTVQLATDAAFTNVIETAQVSGNSYQVAMTLALNTTYYWRARADNACGAGANSAVFSFTTIGAAVCAREENLVELYRDGFETANSGWTTGATVGSNTWARSTTRANGGSFSYRAQDPSTTSDQTLTSPVINLTTPPNATRVQLQFHDYQIFEDPAGSGGCWDGGVIEISVNSGPWQRLEPELLDKPYDGALAGGPLAGDNAWCGSPRPWARTLTSLNAFAGQSVQLRWRLSSDAAVGAEGWYIDDVVVSYCEGIPLAIQPQTLEAPASTADYRLPVAIAAVLMLLSGAAVLARRRA